jgi:glycosyltransferase involved in cell wall biosynthesis
VSRIRIGVDGRVLAIPSMRGWTRYATNLLRALSRRDDVELVVFAREAPCPAHLDGVRAEVVTVDAAREALWNDWRLPQALRAHRIDVFHALADRGLPLRKPCRLVVTLHNSFERAHWPALFPTPRRRLWYWKYELANAWRADAVVTVSDTTRAELLALGVCPPAKLARVYLAAAPEFHAEPEATDAAVLARHGVRAPYVLYVGGYDAHKNVGALVRAFAAAGLDDHQLVIAAARPQPAGDLTDAWACLAATGRLRLVEPAPAELPALYRGGALLVQPSLWESFGLPLVEAMACGLPVLGVRRGATPEILGDAGELVDAGDGTAWASALRTLARDAGRRTALRARGLARARAFSWDRTAAETVDVYRRVLAA